MRLRSYEKGASDESLKVTCLSLDDKGEHLAVGYSDGKVRLWNVKTGPNQGFCVSTWQAQGGEVTAVAAVTKGLEVTVVSGSAGGSVQKWEAGSKQPTQAFSSTSAGPPVRALLLQV